MQVIRSLAQARALFDVFGQPIGFVPTMGALHEGHLELVRQARSECTTVAASIFVNPMQFAPGEDFERYPRDLDADCVKLTETGVDIVFVPSDDEIYPAGFSTAIDVGALASVYEGAIRPGHFRGVATIVAKLLNVVHPQVLYVGQKDAQQTAVLRKMVRDLEIPVHVEVVPTVRDSDGLALSSRNAYLNAAERAQAPSLYRTLLALRDALEAGMSKSAAIQRARSELGSLAVLDYLDVVDADTFEPLEAMRPPSFAIAAARFGATRLLDNVWMPHG